MEYYSPGGAGKKKKKINRLDTTNDLQNGGEKKLHDIPFLLSGKQWNKL